MKLTMKFKGRTHDGKGYIWISEEKPNGRQRMMYVCHVDWFWGK